MRAMLLTALVLPGLLLAAPIAGSEEPSAESAAAAKVDDDKLVLPPGFMPMKRGKYILYCRKESVMGTRLPAMKCYDEDGIRQLVQSLREEREKIDQMRRICGSMEACGGGG